MNLKNVKIMMKLTIVYDNESEPGLKSDWGFSCLIENTKKILFDTGADSEILLYNMKQLKINPEDIDIVVLSHNHWDHTGGIIGFLEANKNKAKVYQPEDFSKPTKISQEVYSTGALGMFTPLNKTTNKIGNNKSIAGNNLTPLDIKLSNGVKPSTSNTYLTGFVKEQSLVVNTKKGNIVITGCAHPGLENIIDKAKELGGIYSIVGGFHGFSKLEKLKGIELIAPCHCTQYKQKIKEKYPANYKEIKAGSVIEI